MDCDQLNVGSSVATHDGYFARILEIHDGQAVLDLTGIGYLRDVPISSLIAIDDGLHAKDVGVIAGSRKQCYPEQRKEVQEVICQHGAPPLGIKLLSSSGNSCSSRTLPEERIHAPFCSPLTVDPNTFCIFPVGDDHGGLFKSISLQKSPGSGLYPADENPRQHTPRSPLEVHDNVVKSAPEDGLNFKEQVDVRTNCDEKSSGTLKIQRSLFESLLERRRNSTLMLRCFHLWQMLMYCR